MRPIQPLLPLLLHARCPPPAMQQAEDLKARLSNLDDELAAAAQLSRSRTVAESGAARAAESAKLKAEKKVTIFGARLDEDVAGWDGVKADTAEEHSQQFDLGVKAMRRGEYKLAVSAFTRAVASVPEGMMGRKGGQYAVYLAEALQASGRKKEAVGLLSRCESHPDQDIRKVSENVLYIYKAPELKLGKENFVSIEPLAEVDDWNTPRRRVAEQKDPPPEKYSLEWYVLEAEKRKSSVAAAEPEPAAPALVASGAILVAAAAVLLTR